MSTRHFARGLASLLLILLGAVSPAAAHHQVHAGVALDALTPAGMVRLEVAAPAAPDRAAHLVFARTGQDRPVLVADVLVAPDSRRARAALAAWEQHHVARVLPAIAGLGDRAAGSEGAIGFVRDNVMITLRRIPRDLDLAPIARAHDAAIQRAPLGSPRGGRVEVRWDDAGQPGAATPIAIRARDAVAVAVQTDGPAAAMQLPEGGWLLTRSGPGAVTVRVIAVDSKLRVSSN